MTKGSEPEPGLHALIVLDGVDIVAFGAATGCLCRWVGRGSRWEMAQRDESCPVTIHRMGPR